MSSYNGSIHHHNLQTKDGNAFTGRSLVGAEHIHASVPRLVGSDLTSSDYAGLEARWVDHALVDRAGLRRVDSLTGGEVIGRKTGNNAGIVIPYRRPGSDQVRDYRLRRDQPDLEYDSSGNVKQRQNILARRADRTCCIWHRT